MSEIAAGAADFISMCSVVEVGESRIKSTNYNYQPFFLVYPVRVSTKVIKVAVIHLDILLDYK